jgi:peptide/nickel transport system ATP-binding protein
MGNFKRAPILVDVRHLSVHYVSPGQPPACAVEDVSFVLREGEILGLVGESGCGKTTLMLSLMRLLPAAGRIVDGEINFVGRDILSLSEKEMRDVRWREMSMIFQGAMNALNPVCTVGDQIAEVIVRHNLAGDRSTLYQRVSELLELVGIAANRHNQYPHQYSGGMRQRAMIAMALCCHPSLLIADEPTTALDVTIQAQVLDLMGDLRMQYKMSILFITHDLGVIASMADDVIIMYLGKIVESATVHDIFHDPKHPYTRGLMNSIPALATVRRERLVPIKGVVPDSFEVPQGCAFEPRWRFAKCRFRHLMRSP